MHGGKGSRYSWLLETEDDKKTGELPLNKGLSAMSSTSGNHQNLIKTSLVGKKKVCLMMKTINFWQS